jgi:hypothetical protein
LVLLRTDKRGKAAPMTSRLRAASPWLLAALLAGAGRNDGIIAS